MCRKCASIVYVCERESSHCVQFKLAEINVDLEIIAVLNDDDINTHLCYPIE